MNWSSEDLYSAYFSDVSSASVLIDKEDEVVDTLELNEVQDDVCSSELLICEFEVLVGRDGIHIVEVHGCSVHEQFDVLGSCVGTRLLEH